MTAEPRGTATAEPGPGAKGPLVLASPPAALRTLAPVVFTAQRGRYRHLGAQATELAARYRPGQFVSVATDGAAGTILRRPLSVLDVIQTGAGLGVELVVAPGNAGTRWLATRRPGDVVDLFGPLGQPFSLPAPGTRALVVGGGHGVVALHRLVRESAAGRAAVTCVVGGSSGEHLVGVDLLSAVVPVQVATDDGSRGMRGTVLPLVEAALAGGDIDIIYACGPMRMLAAVVRAAERAGVRCSVSVEAGMACGYGVCLTCALPVRHGDGSTRMTRICVEGPVLDGHAVHWDALDRIPDDCRGL
jgi:dihydroorotate dehydrogenase electron transfer subunit